MKRSTINETTTRNEGLDDPADERRPDRHQRRQRPPGNNPRAIRPTRQLDAASRLTSGPPALPPVSTTNPRTDDDQLDTAPATTTRVVLPGLVEPAGLQISTAPMPTPVAGQLLVQVEATGISYAEQAMRRGRYYGQPAFPFTPGYDLVGRVLQVGPGGTGNWWVPGSPP